MGIEEKIEKDLAIAEQKVDTAKALQRLMTNSSDFRKVIVEGFLRSHALSLVAKVAKAPNQEAVQREIEAISYFQNYLTSIIEAGQIAIKEVDDFNADLENIRINNEV